MRMHVRPSAPTRAAFLAIALLFALPAIAFGHAELDTSSPADGETVEGTPDEISADFTGTLEDGSTFELRSAAGDVVARGTIDPDDDQRMILDPPELEPGVYEIRWQAQAIGDDGHSSLERGTYEFTVAAAPTQPPTPSAPPSAEPSATATAEPPSAEPSPSASPSPDPTAAASTTDVLLPIIAAVVILAVLAGYLLNRRRSTPPA